MIRINESMNQVGGINDSPTPYLRPLGLNEKLYARKTRIKKIEKHACVV